MSNSNNEELQRRVGVTNLVSEARELCALMAEGEGSDVKIYQSMAREAMQKLDQLKSIKAKMFFEFKPTKEWMTNACECEEPGLMGFEPPKSDSSCICGEINARHCPVHNERSRDVIVEDREKLADAYRIKELEEERCEAQHKLFDADKRIASLKGQLAGTERKLAEVEAAKSKYLKFWEELSDYHSKFERSIQAALGVEKHSVVEELVGEINDLKEVINSCIEGLEGTFGEDFWKSPLGQSLSTKIKSKK